MTLNTTELRERIDSLEWLVARRDVALRFGDDEAAQAAQGAWEDEARKACFEAGAKGRVVWCMGVGTAAVVRHLRRVPKRYKVAFVGGAVGASLVRRALR